MRKGKSKHGHEKADPGTLLVVKENSPKFDKSFIQLGNTGGFNSTGQADSLLELPQIMQHKI